MVFEPLLSLWRGWCSKNIEGNCVYRLCDRNPMKGFSIMGELFVVFRYYVYEYINELGGLLI